MARQWYYTVDGQQGGPVSAQELQALVASGVIQPEHRVRSEAMSHWVRASRVGGLFAAQARTGGWVGWLLVACGLAGAVLVVAGSLAQYRLVERLKAELAQARQRAGPPPTEAAVAASGVAAAPAPTASGPGVGRPGTASSLLAHVPPAPGAPLAAEALARLQTTCGGLGPAFTQYRRQFLAPMHYWATHALGDLPTERVAYLFAGPDAATAVGVFPRARHLVLVANQTLEPAGAATAPARVQEAECAIWRYFARLGYFRTHDLDGRHAARPRVAALVMQGLALADAQVTQAEYLELDASGAIRPVALADGQRPWGLRLHATRPDRSPLVVDYLTIDLSDTALRRNTAEARALQGLLDQTVLMKAASHLPQDPGFSLVATWTAERARALVQDETGLSIDLMRQHFELRHYGQFEGAHQLWRDKASARRLRQDVQASEVQPLLFTFGYEKPAGSLVTVGRRNQPEAVAATAAASTGP